MARRVDEDHRMTIRGLDLVSADSLRDASSLAGGDARFADRVEDRRLAVVHVTEHGDDGWPDDQLAWILVREREQLLARCRDDSLALRGLDRDHVLAEHRLDGEPELVGHD